jgi:hypothetical protein
MAFSERLRQAISGSEEIRQGAGQDTRLRAQGAGWLHI